MSRLEIEKLDQLTQALRDFQNDPTLASTIYAIDIHVEIEEIENESDEDQKNREADLAISLCDGATRLLEAILNSGQLESFEWILDHYSQKIPARSEAFWTMLSNFSGDLKTLDLGFYTHEIHNLKKAGINPVPKPFIAVENLTLRMDDEHGNDAKEFDSMLKQINSIHSLDLRLPGCDLESCRIQGLTYDWQFPNLTSLSISVYIDEKSGLPDFISRHPTIEVLEYNVDSDSPLSVSFSSLPNLRAFSLGRRADNSVATAVDKTNGLNTITHLRVHDAEDAEFFMAHPKNTVRCLEIESSFWDYDAANVCESFKGLLPRLTRIEELGIEFQSGNISWREDGVWVHPAPLNIIALISVLKSFPSDSQLRALRITDDAASPLPEEFIQDISEYMPRCLEFIKWGASSEVEGITKLYRIERKQADDDSEKLKAADFRLTDLDMRLQRDVDSKQLPLRRQGPHEKKLWNHQTILYHEV